MIEASSFVSEGLYPPKKGPDPSLRRLASGILIQAFRDIVTAKSSSKECAAWRQDALEWFLSDERYPGSFHWVCEVLRMDADRLREWLHDYRRSTGARKKEMVKRLVGFQIPQ
jgi:hypothetical protein